MSRSALLRRLRVLIASGIALAAVVQTSGCGSVRAFEKEALADRIMSFEEDSREASRELHWIEAREGSTGGVGTAGGGCACN